MAWRWRCGRCLHRALDRVVAMLGETRPDRHQPALGAGADARRAAQPRAADRAARPPTPMPRPSAGRVETCRRIGEHGLPLLPEIAARKGAAGRESP
jgi:methylthioribose-1-phosphate isomerase